MNYEITMRVYECGCKITSYRNCPSIVYCPKHKFAPDLYEAAKQVSRESGPDMSPSLGAIDGLREALAKAEGNKWATS